MKKAIGNVKLLEKTLKRVTKLFEEQADEEKGIKTAKIFKNCCVCYGVNGPGVNSVFTTVYNEDIKQLSPNDQILTSFEFIKDKYSEMKNLGVKILRKNAKEISSDYYSDVKELSAVYCPSWAFIDILGSALADKILADKSFCDVLLDWSTSDNIWTQRLSCVSFIRIARSGNYTDYIYKICSNTMKNPERFVQLGTGWVLRELSLCDLVNVKKFLKDNYDYFSREGLRYAIEKMNGKDQQMLLNYKDDGKNNRKKQKK